MVGVLFNKVWSGSGDHEASGLNEMREGAVPGIWGEAFQVVGKCKHRAPGRTLPSQCEEQ